MPYDPKALTQADRSRAYLMMWFGGAATIVMAAQYVIAPASDAFGIGLGLSVGSLLGSVIAWRADEYFRSLCAMGHRWAIGLLAAYLFALFVMRTFDLSHSPGQQAVASGVGENAARTLPVMLHDAYFLCLATALAFHAGYAFAWLRGRREADEEA